MYRGKDLKKRKKRFVSFLSGLLVFSNVLVTQPVFAAPIEGEAEILEETVDKATVEVKMNALEKEEAEVVDLEGAVMPQVHSHSEEEIVWDNDMDDSLLPKAYDSREQGHVPSAVRNQGSYSTCWAQTDIALMEIGMIRNKVWPDRNLELSVAHGVYYTWRPVVDPLGLTTEDVGSNESKDAVYFYNTGGSVGMVAKTSMAGMGPVLSTDFLSIGQVESSYNTVEDGKAIATFEKAYGNKRATITEIVYTTRGDREEIKKLILRYGAAGTAYNVASGFNSTYNSHYNFGDYIGTNHAVTIVGWDDEFPKEHFTVQPPEDGAWLIRNSYGPGYGADGYFWLSYCDVNMDHGTGFRVEAPGKYDNIYLYDGISTDAGNVGTSKGGTLETANVFTIQKEKELLTAIQFATLEEGYSYKVKVYKNPNSGNPSSGEEILTKPIEGNKKFKGYYVVNLETPVWLKKDDTIAVCVEIQSLLDKAYGPMAFTDRFAACEPGQSFYKKNNGEWIDCADDDKGNFEIRMFTVNPEENTVEGHDHSWSTDWSYDGDYHWHDCTTDGTCDSHLSHEGRGYEKHHGGTATCKERAKCVDCGEEYGYFLPYNHVGDSTCEVCGEDIPIKDRKSAQNPQYQLNTLEETAVSTKASGKPKVIIFYDKDSEETKSAMESILAGKLAGVDILAIEADNATKENVHDFRSSLESQEGTDKIAFCHGPQSGSVIKEAYENAYKQVFPNTSEMELPIFCYIDGKNNFRYMTSDTLTGDVIKKTLTDYCGYEVNGLNIANPVEVTYNTIDEENPTVSTKAEGKPKVLFIGTEDVSTKESIASIANDFPKGIDFYYIDFGGRDQDQITNFKNNYTPNSEDIIYCYGNDSKGNNGLGLGMIYLEAAGLDPYRFQTPIICYIDENNYLQHVSMGSCDSEQLRHSLLTSCLFVEEEGEEIEPPVSEVTLTLVKPSKTVYLKGESLSVEGGQIGLTSDFMTALTVSMVSGFNSQQTGIQSLTVTYEGETGEFDVIVVEVPQLTAKVGDTLSSISLPVYSYGAYFWKNAEVILEDKGNQSFEAIFIPADIVNYSVKDGIQIEIEVKENDAPITPPVVEEEKYSITFDYGGKLINITEEVKKGETVTRPENPVAEGFEFKGWYKDAELTTPWDFEKDVVEGHLTIYAKWEEKTVTPPVVEEEKYTVSFNHMGKGTDISVEVKKGEKLESPTDPTAEGYLFEGWYTDSDFSKKWNFTTDTVTENLTLYAKWTKEKVDDDQEGEITGEGIRISKIEDLTYNGKAQKPVIEIYDGEILLKKNKDYTISYSQNVESNRGSVVATEEFDATLPTITIKGKGNYTGTRQINFNILKAVIGNETNQEAAGVKISYTDQLVVNTKQEVKPFKSITLGRKLKEGIDYTVSLKAGQAKNAQGEELTGEFAENKIPKGATGTFLLTIEGIGNYQGILEKTITVGEKATLLKNATITLKKEYRSIDLDTFRDEYRGRLPEDAFTIKMSKVELKEGTDYSVSYQEIEKTGRAKLVIQGAGAYGGSKAATFKLTGKKFTGSKVSVKLEEEMIYKGSALTQNNIEVSYEGKLLSEGVDYTVAYSKNINKGTATMTITALADSGYEGSIKKTFKIQPANIKNVEMSEHLSNLVVEYEKAGAKPESQLQLRDASGNHLVKGKDYTVSYKNNREVRTADATEAPTMIVKGKGNFTGMLEIPFTITKASLNSEKINISLKSMAYNGKKADSYVYQPAVTIKDGSKLLSSKTDYTVEYLNTSQAEYRAFYLEEKAEAPQPMVRITAKEGSNYVTEEPILVALPVYRIKLTAKNLYAVIEEVRYTGEQLTPKVSLYYTEDNNIAKGKGITEEEKLIELGFVKLTEEDYSISYGKNLIGGKNKGSIIVSGKGSQYGGKVTFKFNIMLKDL